MESQKFSPEFSIDIDGMGKFDALTEKYVPSIDTAYIYHATYVHRATNFIYRYAGSPKALTVDAERLLETRIMKDQELARKTEELYSTLAKKNRELEK